MSEEMTETETPAKKEMTVQEAGRKGGNRVKELYGSEFYAKAGKIGGARTKEKHGPEFYREIGRAGGNTTKERYGDEHFREMGERGGARVQELVRKAKEAETHGE
jgi:general stress protein YciG